MLFRSEIHAAELFCTGAVGARFHGTQCAFAPQCMDDRDGHERHGQPGVVSAAESGEPDLVAAADATGGFSVSAFAIAVGRDVRGVEEAQAFLHAALADELGDGVGDVEVVAPVRRFKPEMLGEAFHAA